jgi:hypothetical protein
MTTYRVSGSTAYMDHQPGETFEAELEPGQEQRALERGSIEIVKGKAKTTEEASDA